MSSSEQHPAMFTCEIIIEPIGEPGFTCEICFELIRDSKPFTNESKCSHPFCINCIKEYVQIKIQDKTGGGIIECPGLDCENRLDPSSCESIIGPKLFVEWCDLLLERAIPWPDLSFCPNKDCLELVVNECGGHVRRSKCPNCKELFCFQCSSKWPGIGDRNHKCGGRNGKNSEMNDVLFMRLMKRKRWVKCPGCGRCIELVEGCANIHCRCSTSFCYKCGRKICACRRHPPPPRTDEFEQKIACVILLSLVIILVGIILLGLGPFF